MLDDPDNYNFEGEGKELSVLFSDIRDFTSISEHLPADKLKAFLNEYLTPITGLIFDNKGTIDKYIGDLVMAFWGAPVDDPKHHYHAVITGLQMLDKIKELNVEFEKKDFPHVRVGIGINSGFMNVGDMGSTYRRAYTVLGDAVNLGSRLESITKFYGVSFLIGEETHDHIEGVLCRQIDKVKVKGKDDPVRIYEPLCLEKDATEELLAKTRLYNKAFTHYLQQEWDDAAALFSQLQESEPDALLYSVYLERIADLRQQDLGSDWDGTFRHTSK